MKRRGKSSFPSKYILLLLTVICIMLLFAGYATGYAGEPIRTICNYVFVPMQKGLDYVGESISINSDDTKTKEQLIAENAQLQEQIDELSTQLTNTRLQQSELDTLRELYDLDQTYADYKTTGAHVIGKGTSNWFNTFTIDKGSKDGIKVDMNVIAGSGLVGIVTDVGKNYAVVRAIIDDTSNVSGMILSNNDNCIVSGNLKSMTESNMITFSNLEDSEDKVSTGDSVVTSNISDKYLPGLLIGYVTDITEDNNNLTKSGEITPVVDFKHLQDVLVIMQLKETGK
ncbi:rod shape-determining protein MreC [Roseburia sp. AM51-8]|uniref:Cell shape-determining protein MreC n=1 Tax=Roseburia lenta TaxID=2763061 RepID=A0ABR7GCI2_9FIRM|nr:MULTISPECIES: rod shape-determining protein MreC [Roseburia]MBC5685134.1 rod shape-determining protein MreC [Roseburia lenta]RHQ02510.1 rod shape-determining protein MreC [Roseburia sp. AM51-8]